MKITAIVGSPRNNGSCYNIIKKIKDELQQINSELHFNTIILSEHNIQFCKGCMHCFSKHRCLITDDMFELSKKLLVSDIVIISSPVYFQGTSAILKNFMKQLNRTIQKINTYDNLEYIKTSIEQQNIFDYYKNKYKDSIKDYYFKSEVVLWKETVESNSTFDEYFNYKRSLQKAGDKNDRE